MPLRFIDTHAHLYDAQFDADRPEDIQRAIQAGVDRICLPNCDLSTIEPMMSLTKQWPENCFAMMGLHPCYVKDNFMEELKAMEQWLSGTKFAAIGEIGLDYYWDTTFVAEQKTAFRHQVAWALRYNLPVVIHTRSSMPDGIEIVRENQNGSLKGVFHCFGGSIEEAHAITELGFYLGIGGTATFKNSTLTEVLSQISLDHILLETDAPYLAPVPYRGKRNESAYIPLIAARIAEIKQCSVEEVAEATTRNAELLFGL